jgi:hypothetical protein
MPISSQQRKPVDVRHATPASSISENPLSIDDERRKLHRAAELARAVWGTQ